MKILADHESAKLFDGALQGTGHGRTEEGDANAVQPVRAAHLDRDEVAGRASPDLAVGQRLVGRKLHDVSTDAIDLHGGISPKALLVVARACHADPVTG